MLSKVRNGFRSYPQSGAHLFSPRGSVMFPDLISGNPIPSGRSPVLQHLQSPPTQKRSARFFFPWALGGLGYIVRKPPCSQKQTNSERDVCAKNVRALVFCTLWMDKVNFAPVGMDEALWDKPPIPGGMHPQVAKDTSSKPQAILNN